MAGTFYVRYKKRIGIICDAVLFDSFASAADFVYLSPADWQEKIKTIDLFLAVSTWRGLHDDEWLGVGRVGHPMREKFSEVINACRAYGIPTAFYSKEDPPNYGVFLDFAKKCDVVFTSAEEMIPRYRADCKHDRVYVLPFCVDPALQNPIGCRPFRRGGGIVFSGSWTIKYPFRCRDLAALLDGARRSKRELVIVDRNSFRSGIASYRFPRRFQKYLRPRMPHDELQLFHKQFEWSINVNSVTTSETMFAGRCYELLACGCPVMSNFSIGMLHRLPEVAIADSAHYASMLIRTSASKQMQVRRSAGIRRVMSGETCYDRIGDILRAVGFDVKQPARSVAVVVPVITPSVRADFDAQTYPRKRLYTDSEFSPDVRAQCDYFISWLPGEKHGPFQLQDLIDVFKYTDADFAVDGAAYYAPVTDPVPGHTMFRRGSASATKGFGIPRCDDTPADIESLCVSAHEIVSPAVRALKDIRPPVWVRALACLEDNGLLYTLRRIFFGRQY